MSFQALLLAGGQSSRMGARKELLRFTDTSPPLYLHLARVLKAAFPALEVVYISLRDPSAVSDILEASANSMQHVQLEGLVKGSGTGSGCSKDEEAIAFRASGDDGVEVRIRFLYDEDMAKTMATSTSNLQRNSVDQESKPKSKSNNIGPAAGLLAAHSAKPTATWLVVACDYPLLSTSALHYLQEQHYTIATTDSGTNASSCEPPLLTCYRNTQGYCEPLLGMWTPEALSILARNVEQGRTGPRFVIEELGSGGKGQVRLVVPRDERWLFNANTVGEWREAVGLFMEGKGEERKEFVN
ncbi:hypothetical protein AJ79_03242 [Helicocarpus griseus UAMH5409]|uniref:MobA-like NTP transferase domain-containing protein n=1 Tax=Helicocarpus griseus UAMH5409 TaxID=1447875 RepID=A0A2B7XYV4_9EURO|nr:hypothetical protein AJ79_03242 [Helicocarpus griseus UAMH5409]